MRFQRSFNLGMALALAGCGGNAHFQVPPGADVFGQQVVYNNKVDVLWVVDNSRSMSQHQQRLAQKIGAMIDVLSSKRLDFQMGITSMDMGSGGARGRFVGTPAVLNSSMPNIKGLFQARVVLGENGSDVERGLEAMTVALSPERLAAENSGFLREEAFLAIIFVTNEDDFSSGQVSGYFDRMNELKPTPAGQSPLWMASFIGITEPNGDCFTRGEIADPGDRYMELADLSGGQVAEICADDLTGAISNVRARIIERLTEFRLGKEPIPDSISVSVNGVAVPRDETNGWTYHPEGWIVRFHGDAVPAADAVIRIHYQPRRAN